MRLVRKLLNMDADRVESPMMSDDADNAILADRDDPEMDEDVPGRPSLKTPEDALQFWNTTFQQVNAGFRNARLGVGTECVVL